MKQWKKNSSKYQKNLKNKFRINNMLVGIFIVSVFALLCFYLIKKHLRQLQLSRKLKGPQGIPVFGNGLELANKTPIGEMDLLKGSSILVKIHRVY